MTARDAAPETGSTDAVVTDDAPEPADATSPGTDATSAGTADAPDTDTDATSHAGADGTDADDAGTPDATTAADDTAEESVASPGRKGRRRRHRHAEGDEADATTDAATADTGDEATASTRRGSGRAARWVVAALLLVSVLFAGAMAGLYVANRPAPIAGLSSSQQAAVDAATQAAINLQTFRRASFDQDFANALASLTPDFAQQQLLPRKDTLKTQLTQGGRDASATALSAGLVSSTSTQAVVLVVTNTTQTADDGTSTPFVFSRLQLTLQRLDGKWLVSDLQSVGLS